MHFAFNVVTAVDKHLVISGELYEPGASKERLVRGKFAMLVILIATSEYTYNVVGLLPVVQYEWLKMGGPLMIWSRDPPPPPLEPPLCAHRCVPVWAHKTNATQLSTTICLNILFAGVVYLF